MDTDGIIRRILSTYRLIVLGLGLCIAYWVLESLSDVYLFHKGTLIDRLFFADHNELWMRLFVSGILLGMTIFVFALTRLTKYKLILLGAGMSAIYWFIESLVHVFLFRQNDLIHQILSPDRHELWMRSFVILLLLGFGVLGQSVGKLRKQSKEALEKSEERFRALVENSTDIVMILRANGTVLYASSSMNRIMGYSLDEVVGKDSLDFIHEDDGVPFAGELGRSTHRVGSTVSLKFRFRHKDGSWRVFEGTGKNLIDHPEIRGVIINARDVTERTKTEKAFHILMETLKQGKQEWESTVDSLPELVCLMDYDGGILRLNRTVETWGLGRVNKTKGLYFHALLHPGCTDDTCYLRILWEKISTSHGKNLPVETEAYDTVLKRHLIIRFRPLINVPREKAVGNMVAVVQDVTHQKRMEDILVRRQAALQAVYQIAITPNRSLETICDQVVLNLSTLLKAPVVEIQRREEDMVRIMSRYRDGDFIHDLVRALKDVPCAAIYDTKTILQLSGQDLVPAAAAHCDHARAARTCVGVPIKDSIGEIVGSINVFDFEERTFTNDEFHLIEIFGRYVAYEFERTVMEHRLRLSKELEAVGLLAAGVAHEVRNPLNAILSVTEALFQSIGEDETHTPFLVHIRSQVDRLSRIMRDLLDLGKPVVPSQLRREPLLAIIRTSVDLWAQSAPRGAQSVQVVPPPAGDDMWVMSESPRLQQVFFNLLENATQHSPGGAPIIVVVHPSAGPYVRVSVTDRGPGVPSENLPHVFDPFFTTRSTGIGLGLSIVKHIVDSHGGNVVIVNNDPPPGCTVDIRLPIARPHDASAPDSHR